MAKQLSENSRFAKLDLDNDGTVTDEEISHAKDMLELELREEKAYAQKRMAWVAVSSMVGFALLPLIPWIPESRLSFLASLSDMLFLSQASIVGFYFGAQAYMAKK
tara:strand:+ start:1307 stop:1624 length:318 start_codon:yes stop_codon:yes gene_type:complete